MAKVIGICMILALCACGIYLGVSIVRDVIKKVREKKTNEKSNKEDKKWKS